MPFTNPILPYTTVFFPRSQDDEELGDVGELSRDTHYQHGNGPLSKVDAVPHGTAADFMGQGTIANVGIPRPAAVIPCLAKRVLVWDDNGGQAGTGEYDELLAVFAKGGIPADRKRASWTGDIFDYSSIFWCNATDDPPWIDSVLQGLWPGNLIISTDWPFARHRVLLWEDNSVLQTGDPDVHYLTTMKGIYEAAGVRCDYVSTYTGNIFDYDLIVWPCPDEDAPWVSQIQPGGGWAGRLVISSFNFSIVGNIVDLYINTLPFGNLRSHGGSFVGFGLGDTPFLPFGTPSGAATGDPMAAGQPFIYGSFGEYGVWTPNSTAVYEDGNFPGLAAIVARMNTPMETIVVASTSILRDETPNSAALNAAFFLKLLPGS